MMEGKWENRGIPIIKRFSADISCGINDNGEYSNVSYTIYVLYV